MELKFKTKGAKYKVTTAAIFLILLFFLTSRITFNAPDEDENTDLRVPIDFDPVTLEMTDRTYFSEDNLLEIDLMVTENSSQLPPKLKAVVKEKSDPQINYNPELIKIRDDFYVLFVRGLPKDWKSVSVQVIDENSDDDSTFGKMYSSAAKTKTVDVFVKKNRDFYEAKYIDLKIKDNQKLIQEEKKKQRKLNLEITQLRSQSSSLQKDIEYQIGDEKSQTESRIQSNSEDIKSKNEAIQESENTCSELLKRIELLKKRKSHLVLE
ncbi:hypothetical protein K1I48_23195 [Bacillus licheniformis]|uniref:hypothetical protein n=1 Tax=Bacillus subtilis group TaxID=653685 RepID=UPI001C63BA25|nr:hypothetical protein [Bacillus licheniformis]MBW7636329.1 hypothetical protein [Bacillus licheniformis]MED4505087.1 hypothetical protein [Bacillus licheniformis]